MDSLYGAGVTDRVLLRRDLPARLGDGRAEARRDGRDLGAGVRRPPDLLRRDRLRLPHRRPRAVRRHPHLRDRDGGHRLARRRRRHRRRLRPRAEAAEALAKAAPLLAAIGAGSRLRRRAGGARGALAAPGPLRLAAQPVPRPDPAAGVFETILVAELGAGRAGRAPRAPRSGGA